MCDKDGVIGSPLDREMFRLRSYQAEMVEQSLRSNVIVVMDTGSGKTHIAIERTRAELEMCSSDQLVWFLTPTVTLCEQQSEVFKRHLPGYGIQSLTGKDGVEYWTEQGTWDTVLHNIHIVLSTHQVLLDALTHGFVQMSRIALLVFDEAHHCTLNHPARRIMTGFYKPKVIQSCSSIPKILGLTASPVMRALARSGDLSKNLEEIEKNLHATVKTPRMHRSELIQYVHQPELVQVDYDIDEYSYLGSTALRALRYMHTGYDLEQDPYVLDLRLKSREGLETADALRQVYIDGKTYCSEQLRSMVNKGNDTVQELGVSAVEWYLYECVRLFERMVQTSDHQSLDWSNNEKLHILMLLKKLPLTKERFNNPIPFDNLSIKVEKLVKLLEGEAKSNLEFTGIVFVEQRVWVTILAEILTSHPKTKDVFRVGTFVGGSQSSQRKANIATLPEPRNQQATLDDFRAGKINLILATSVLEEGIDVSSCNLVVCFESPKNLKSFVQRRGRARKQASKYFIFVPASGQKRAAQSWQALEADMKAAYEDDTRDVRSAQERERVEEESARQFHVPSTGALLTLDNASQHLYHFCALLTSGPYADTRPQFEIFTYANLVRARVILPLSVDPSLRTSDSLELWHTERMAKKDAAFEAYKALHKAGLVNDNLLPSREQDEDLDPEYQSSDPRPAMVEVEPLLDPWLNIFQHRSLQSHVWCRTLVTIHNHSPLPLQVVLLTPVTLPKIPETVLHWNENKDFRVETSWLSEGVLSSDELGTLQSITQHILHTIFGSRMPDGDKDFVYLLAPSDSLGQGIELLSLRDWVSRFEGQCSLSDHIRLCGTQIQDLGLISRQGDQRKYILTTGYDLSVLRTRSTDDDLLIPATRVPKRRDFLHKVVGLQSASHAYTRIEQLTISETIMNKLPARYSIIALLLPSILHRVETVIIAEELRTSILRPVGFQVDNFAILIRAMTSSSADEEANYQRLEFLGDCILKFVASVHLMSTHPTWPESYLTGKKSRIVSNGFLARAALAAGLERFIFTKRFTGSKWRPRYVHDIQASTNPGVRELRSSKLIADVIESLIGASYVVGGLSKALVCIQTLLPQEKWTSMDQATSNLYDNVNDTNSITGLAIPEALIGRTFSKKMILVEALTHGSYIGPNVYCSYERLEFLGDAVLDYIVSERLYRQEPEISHQKMHTIRTSMVNASFLTFRMFEMTIKEEVIEKASMRSISQERALWQYLRSGSHQVVAARQAALEQHKSVHQQITAALAEDTRFPWHLMAMLDAPKFLSDIVESVIGAIFIDAHGDIAACKEFVRRLGILDCLERILRDDVDCLHPKERLGHLAVDKDVKYVRVRDDRVDGVDRQYNCQVKVGGVDVGGVVRGPKRLNAETIAAWHAAKALESDNDAVMRDDDDSDVFFEAEEGGIVLVND